MAMTTGTTGGFKADINVTPMIDVLLVLLIIFMIVAPVQPVGLSALVPQPPKDEPTNVPERNEIVVSVRADGSVHINQEPISIDLLQSRLRQIFANAGDRVIFVKGDRDLYFRQVAQVVDLAKGAGINRVALMTTP